MTGVKNEEPLTDKEGKEDSTEAALMAEFSAYLSAVHKALLDDVLERMATIEKQQRRTTVTLGAAFASLVILTCANLILSIVVCLGR